MALKLGLNRKVISIEMSCEWVVGATDNLGVRH